MTTSISQALPTSVQMPAIAGRALIPLTLATLWIHFLNAAVVHPQANASFTEHAVQALLALTAIPLAYLAYTRVGRAWRGTAAVVSGAGALTVGAGIHLAGVIRNGAWTATDVTGVAMGIAGIILLVLGVALVTRAIPRLRYRILMVPATILMLLFLMAPMGFGVFVTHVPRRAIEPQDLGAVYEEVSFETSDGFTLRGWYVPSQNGAAVAVVHGSGGSRMSGTLHARLLIRSGYGVLVFDVRGHGESSGATNALGWGAHPDLAAAADYLAARAEVEPGRVGVLGLSMGAELAIESAAHSDGFAAVVADGASGRTFADTLDASLPLATKIVALGPLFVSDLAVTALSGEPPPPGLTNLSPQITEPVLYIASGVDPAERALVTKIAKRSGGAHELWVIDGAGHTQGLKQFPEEYEARVTEFFDRYLLGTSFDEVRPDSPRER
jgi:dienelactone hydrolase